MPVVKKIKNSFKKMFPKKIMHKYLIFTVTIKWINFNAMTAECLKRCHLFSQNKLFKANKTKANLRAV